jgi:hypothetical protein
MRKAMRGIPQRVTACLELLIVSRIAKFSSPLILPLLFDAENLQAALQ